MDDILNMDDLPTGDDSDPDEDESPPDARSELASILSLHGDRYFHSATDAMNRACGSAQLAESQLKALEQYGTAQERWAALPTQILQEVFVRGIPWVKLCEWMGVPLVSFHTFREGNEELQKLLEDVEGLAADVAAQEADQLMSIPVSAPAVANRLSAMASHLRWLAGSLSPGKYGSKSIPKPERRGALNVTALPEVAPPPVEGRDEAKSNEGLANLDLPDLSDLGTPQR